MSMIGNLARIPEEVRVSLHQHPESITRLLYPDFDFQPYIRKTFLSRLFGKKPPLPEPLEERKPEIPASDLVDLDKSWHILHYLLTGSDWEGPFPQGFLVSCGRAVGDIDIGYGPARSFSSEEVREIAAYLKMLDRVSLRGRLAPDRLRGLEIYPSYWTKSEDLEDDWERLESGIGCLTDFVGETAERGMALLVYIN